MKKQLIVLLPFVLVAALLSGCAVSNPNTTSSHLLYDAAKDGRVQDVTALLDQGSHINEIYFDMTALSAAAYYGHADVVQILLARGANIEIKTTLGHGMTPLSYAAIKENTTIINMLLAKGADIQSAIKGLERAVSDNLPYATSEHPAQLQFLKECNAGIKLLQSLFETVGRIEVGVADPQEEAAFAKAAQDYHDVTTKPVLPEEARKFKVQAEQSVGDKKFDEAAELYKKALVIAPWWPEGHFNRAIVLGESRYYQGAIREMKRYLILVPNAPDARAAQDKIYAWELKAGK